MPNITKALENNDIKLLRRQLAFYLNELVYGIENDKRDISCFDYYGLAIIDILTNFNYSLPRKYRVNFLNMIQHSMDVMKVKAEEPSKLNDAY